MQVEEYFTGKLNTAFYGIGVVEIQFLISGLYFIKAYFNADLTSKLIRDFCFFDLIFYPLFTGMILLGLSKYMKFYKICI